MEFEARNAENQDASKQSNESNDRLKKKK